MWQALRTWWSSQEASTPEPPRRWVVVDVESSGLDAARDRLLAIAAVAVHFDDDFRRPRIELGDSFEVLLRQDGLETQQVDKANILIHGIGVGAQRSGLSSDEALRAWEAYAADSPLVAYHSAFDQTMIQRAGRRVLGRVQPNPWLDVEPLAALVHNDPRRRALDHWLSRHHIHCLVRHQAAADTLATAQLLLTLWPAVRARTDGRFAGVADWAESHRFMPGRSGSR